MQDQAAGSSWSKPHLLAQFARLISPSLGNPFHKHTPRMQPLLPSSWKSSHRTDPVWITLWERAQLVRTSTFDKRLQGWPWLSLLPLSLSKDVNYHCNAHETLARSKLVQLGYETERLHWDDCNHEWMLHSDEPASLRTQNRALLILRRCTNLALKQDKCIGRSKSVLLNLTILPRQ